MHPIQILSAQLNLGNDICYALFVYFFRSIDFQYKQQISANSPLNYRSVHAINSLNVECDNICDALFPIEPIRNPYSVLFTIFDLHILGNLFCMDKQRRKIKTRDDTDNVRNEKQNKYTHCISVHVWVPLAIRMCSLSSSE